MNSASYEDPNTIALSTWTNSGKNNTKLLVEAGNSPAANAIDYYNGWYIPDAVQLMRMFSLIPVLQDYFVAAGGNLALLGTAERNYWSSSRRGNYMVCLQNTNNWGGKYFEVSGTTEYYIRPVRDFGYEAHAYWLDNPKSASMTVNPEVTTTYDAVVVFGADTFPLTGTVAVHEKFDKDTLYETVCSSNLPYTSAVNPIFRNLDISRPHDYEPIRVTLQTIHGCDSIITLMLKVNESYIFTKNVAVCVSDTPYSWRGRTFSQNGVYFDSLSTICCSCDSVYQLNLQIVPLPEITTEAIVGACEGASITLSASSVNCSDFTQGSIHEGFNRVSGNESTSIANNLSSMTNYISTGQYVYPVGNSAIKIGSSNYTGYITTKPLNLSKDFTLTLMCKGNYNTNNPSNEYAAQLQVSLDGVAMDTLIIPANKNNHDYELFMVNLPAATASSTIKLQTIQDTIPGNNWAEKRVLIDDILISDNTSCSYVWWRGTSDTVSHASTANVTPNVSAPTYEERFYVQATSAVGCKSVDSTLVVNLQFPLEESVTICENELPYTWRDTIFEVGTAMSGTYVFHRTSVAGCDSVVTLALTIYEMPRDTVYKNIALADAPFTCENYAISKMNGTQYTTPVDNSYRYSCSQQIFTSAEVGPAGKIDSISFNYAYSNPMTVKNKVKIYLAHTNKTTFSSTTDWMSPSNMTLVYSGNLNCKKGWNNFSLSTPFEYNGTDNLMVMVLDSSNNYNSSTYTFYYTNTTGNRGLTWHSNSYYWNASRSGTLRQNRSDIRFHICQQSYEFANKTFIVEEPGVYKIIDTLTDSNGCDSITVRYLIVEEPHEDEICDSTFTEDQTWVDNVGPYCWEYNGKINCIADKDVNANGYYEFTGPKTIEGFTVDTISYLKLLINPTYRDTNDLNICLFGNDTTVTDAGRNISIFINGDGSEITVTSTNAEKVTVERLKVGDVESATDFVLKRKTAKGCDSIEVLHIETTFVQRDTVSMETLFETSAFTCVDKTISNQNGSGHTVPLNDYFVYSCSQQIFTPDEIGNAGSISKLSFNYAYSTATTKLSDVYIYLGHTGKSSFSSGTDWVQTSAMKLVYHGPLNCHQGWNEFTLDTPFDYNGTDNLVIMVNDVSSGGYESSSYNFYYTNSTKNNVALAWSSDSYTWNTSRSGSRYNYRSDIRFYGCSYPTVEFADKTFTVTNPGTYVITDTVTGSNGCDSITVRYLIVEEPHEDEICDSTFTENHIWVDNVGPYCWHYNDTNNCIAGKTVNADGYYEFPGTKIIDGFSVDTISYLKLTINPTYRDTNTVTTCLNEIPTIITYPVNGSNLNLSATASKVTVTNTVTGVTVDTINAAKGDFALKMLTAKGCDSVIILHVNTLQPSYSDTTASVCGSFTWYGVTYTSVPDELPTHVISGGNAVGCDSIVRLHLTLNAEIHETKDTTVCGQFEWDGDTYTATQTIVKTFTSALDCDSVVTMNLTVNPNPVVTLSDLTVCPDAETVNITATLNAATTPSYKYEWSGDLTVSPTPVTTDQLTASTTATVPDAPASCGQTYTMNVKVTDGNGCEATDDATVTVKTPTKPVISTLLTDDNLGCNPTVPTLTTDNFTVTDECNTAAKVKLESAESNADCQHTKVWTATYANVCGLKADTVKVTYTWTEDNQKPVIATNAVSGDKGCNPTISAPTFTGTDNCEGEISTGITVTTDGVQGTGCEKSQTWKATYTDACGNKAD
ncbi:MAG: hypothetical protein K5846_02810, partial [Bacteroidales bacterium]|nr:hypothetical protein [Bacteroidales bacterium]